MASFRRHIVRLKDSRYQVVKQQVRDEGAVVKEEVIGIFPSGVEANKRKDELDELLE